MLKIWGRMSSLNVRKVVVTAQELGIEFERIDAGAAFGITRTPDYLAKNPNALVPLIEDDEVQLWESNVIVRYLCARHSSGRLYPIALPARFDAERWMDWQQTTLNPPGRDAFVQWIRTPADRRDPDAISRSVAATEPVLAVLDGHLEHRPYVAGDQVTMAGPAAALRGPPLGQPAAAAHGVPAPRSLVRADDRAAVDARRARRPAELILGADSSGDMWPRPRGDVKRAPHGTRVERRWCGRSAARRRRHPVRPRRATGSRRPRSSRRWRSARRRPIRRRARAARRRRAVGSCGS